MAPFYDQLLAHSGALAAALATLLSADPLEPPVESIPVNREWDVLTEKSDPRTALRAAGIELGDWPVFVGGAQFDGPTLTALADTPEEEPLVRAVRERLRRPVDLEDLLYFLDDLLAANNHASLRGRRIWVTPARARNAGINLHVDDVFWRKRPRLYPGKYEQLYIDRPKRPDALEPALDGDFLGPRWWARFQNPDQEEPAMAALTATNASFAARARTLIEQLRAQGTTVFVASTVRFRERGYLMWGAFLLSRCDSQRRVERTVHMLDQLNRDWELNIDIDWMHPDGWEATVAAARLMADAYDVVYATRAGAEKSDHYDGMAIDVVAVGLPRELHLKAPDDAERTFDLSAANESRDLSLTPNLIDWIEEHFQFDKLRRDYPHWSDATPD